MSISGVMKYSSHETNYLVLSLSSNPGLIMFDVLLLMDSIKIKSVHFNCYFGKLGNYFRGRPQTCGIKPAVLSCASGSLGSSPAAPVLVSGFIWLVLRFPKDLKTRKHKSQANYWNIPSFFVTFCSAWPPPDHHQSHQMGLHLHSGCMFDVILYCVWQFILPAGATAYKFTTQVLWWFGS